jgi:hypothetical protein
MPLAIILSSSEGFALALSDNDNYRFFAQEKRAHNDSATDGESKWVMRRVSAEPAIGAKKTRNSLCSPTPRELPGSFASLA